MQRTGVKASDILSEIKEPDSLYKDVENRTLISVKKVNGNSIVVAYKTENNGAKVITLALLHY